LFLNLKILPFINRGGSKKLTYDGKTRWTFWFKRIEISNKKGCVYFYVNVKQASKFFVEGRLFLRKAKNDKYALLFIEIYSQKKVCIYNRYHISQINQ
jgi:hypothetical protein